MRSRRYEGLKKPRKSMRDFILEHRMEIDAVINGRLDMPNTQGERRTERTRITDKDRREWIMNDEPLYRWAQMEGVRV